MQSRSSSRMPEDLNGFWSIGHIFLVCATFKNQGCTGCQGCPLSKSSITSQCLDCRASTAELDSGDRGQERISAFRRPSMPISLVQLSQRGWIHETALSWPKHQQGWMEFVTGMSRDPSADSTIATLAAYVWDRPETPECPTYIKQISISELLMMWMIVCRRVSLRTPSTSWLSVACDDILSQIAFADSESARKKIWSEWMYQDGS
jgi:hypothetical protein